MLGWTGYLEGSGWAVSEAKEASLSSLENPPDVFISQHAEETRMILVNHPCLDAISQNRGRVSELSCVLTLDAVHVARITQV